MKLEWGPLIEMSFIIDLCDWEEITKKLKELEEEWIYINNLNYYKDNLGSTEWAIIADKKFFDIDINKISSWLLLINFSFIFHTWINGEVYWIDNTYISTKLRNLLLSLKGIFQFHIWMIDKENDILSYFNSQECWPNEEYNIQNFNLQNLLEDKNILHIERNKI